MRNRNISIMIYLNEEEYSILQQDLKRSGLTQSKYLRALIMKRPVREKLPIDYYRMLTELSRIGNNLNQIARVVNQNPSKTPDIEHGVLIMKALYAAIMNNATRTHDKDCTKYVE